MKRFRSLLFWFHLLAGLAAGVVIVIMSVTGVALTYQRQMQWWADTRHYQAEPPPGATRLSATMLIDAVAAWDGGGQPTGLAVRADPAAPAAVTLGGRTVYVNPYTAHVYGEGTGARWRAFFGQMVSWHRYLAMTGDDRAVGRAVTGAANLLFLGLVLSGLYLWWPRSLTWTRLRQILWFRRGLGGKARDFNWHNVLGFWSAIPLAIVVYSGVVISYPWASNMVYRVYGEEPPAARRPGPPVAGPQQPARESGSTAASTAPGDEGSLPAAAPDVEHWLRLAMGREPDWTIVSVRLPATDVATVTVDRGDGGQPQLRGTLTVDAVTGMERSWEGFDAQSPARQARSFLRFAHTGEYFGLTGQTIAGLVSAAAVVLVYSGVALSLRRLAAWRARRRTDRSLDLAA